MAIPAPDQPGVEPAKPSPEVSITIGDGKEAVSAGQMVRYQVVVHNSGATETPLTVKLTMPAHAVTGLEASDAAVVANAVAWKNVVAAGETRTYALAGRVDRVTRARSLAVTACVHERLDAPAVACATDRNELAAAVEGDAGARRMAWIGAILFGILAAIGAVWLYRKVKPEPLAPVTPTTPVTPVTPTTPVTPGGANKPPLPGGAPSD